MGKKTPLYSGGNNPTVTPHTSPAESGTTAWPAVLPLPLAVLPLGPERYYRSGRAVLPQTSGTTAPTAAASTIKPDTKKTPRIEAVLARDRSGTTAGGYQRYYRSGVVLPLVAPKWYYRSGPRYYRWDQRGPTERGERAHQRSGKARRVCKGSVRDDSTLAFPKRTSS